MNNDTTSTIQSQAMLFSLTIKQWSAKVTDKVAGAEVEAEKNAKSGVVDVRKKLVFDPIMDAIKKLGNEARIKFYTMSLPWGDDGRRLVSAKNFMKVEAVLGDYKRKYDTLVAKAEGKYATMIDEARAQLVGLFREEDYPTSISEKFGFEVRVEPIASIDDIRIGLGEGERAKIAERLKEQIEASAKLAKRDIFERIQKCVARIAEDLPQYDPEKKGKDKGTFRDTLVTNVAELIDGLDGLNFDNDQSVATLGNSLRSLVAYTPDQLREDKASRKQVAESAQDILKSMAGYCGVIG